MKQQHMKFTAALCAALLTAMLFAGCAAKPQNDTVAPAQADAAQSQSSTQQEESPQPAKSQGALRVLGGQYTGTEGASGQYYYSLLPLVRGQEYYWWYIDLAAGKQQYRCKVPGCTHTSKQCGAWWDMQNPNATEEKRIWFATSDAVYWLEGGQTKPTIVSRTGTNAEEETVLFTLAGEAVPQAGSMNGIWSHQISQGVVCVDDTAMYFGVTVTQASTQDADKFTRHLEVVRAELATGEQTVIFIGEPDTDFIGMLDTDQLVSCTQDALVLDIVSTSATQHTGSLSGDSATLHHTLVALPREGAPQGEPLPVLYEYPQAALQNIHIQDGVLYTVNAEQAGIDALALATGETRTIIAGLPAFESAQINYVFDGKLFFYLLRQGQPQQEDYVVDLTDGALQQLTLQYIRKMGSQVATVMPLASVGDDFLVIFEERFEIKARPGIDGTSSANSTEDLYALISKTDYYAGNPNYREIEMLSQAEATQPAT